MTVRELEWLKKNLEVLDDDDHHRLEELQIVSFIREGTIRLPISQLASAMEEAAVIIGKYMSVEENL